MRHALRSLLSKEGATQILLLIKGMNKNQTIKVTHMTCSEAILNLVNLCSITHSNSHQRVGLPIRSSIPYIKSTP